MKTLLKISLILLSIVVFSCGEKEKNSSIDKNSTNRIHVNQKKQSIKSDSDSLINNTEIIIEEGYKIPKATINEFVQGRKNTRIENKILVEIGFCKEGKDFDSILCSSRFFKFNSLFKKDLFKGCILSISGELFSDKTSSTKTNRHIVYEKENNKWVIVNEFEGSLKEILRNNSGFASTLIFEFKVDKETYIYCEYKWAGAKYNFKNCIGISKDRGETQIKYTEKQMSEFREDIKQLIEMKGFAK